MKKFLFRALSLAGLLAVALLPACTSYDDTYDGGYGSSGVGVSVSVYGGYYPAGWGGCCYGGPVGMPRPMPVHY